MSYNGSGTFVVNSAGQPVVTGTVISSTAFNALTADLATGLSTAITKDGQTTTTVRVPFAQGISSTLVTDATSATTGSIITAGGISTQKALWVGTTSRHVGATQFDAAITYGGVTLSNAVTGTGNMVLSASPTLTGTLTAAAGSFSGQLIGKGTTTNDSAAAGYIGEYIESVIATPGVSPTSGNPIDVGSISLTAGDWDVSGLVVTSGSAVLTQVFAWVSATSATLPSPLSAGGFAAVNTPTAVATGTGSLVTGVARFSLSGTTTVYLSTRATYTSTTPLTFGVIRARRVR